MKHLNFKTVFVVLMLLAVTGTHAFAEDASSAETKDKQNVREVVKSQRDEVTKAFNAFKQVRDNNSTVKLTHLTALGDRVVDARLKALAEMQRRIDSGKCSKIDVSVKTVMTTDIKTMTDKLNGQKATIDASTTVDAAKTNIKTVYESNRVFIHFIPALNGICASEKVLELITNKIDPTIAKLKNAGIDVTSIQNDVDKAKTAATNAQKMYEKVAADPGASTAGADLRTATDNMVAAKTALNDAKDLLEKAASGDGSSPDDSSK